MKMFYFLLSLNLILGFQNCANNKFSETVEASAATASVSTKSNCAGDPSQQGCKISKVVIQIFDFPQNNSLSPKVQFNFDVAPTNTTVTFGNNRRMQFSGANLTPSGDSTMIEFNLVMPLVDSLTITYTFAEPPAKYNAYLSSWTTMLPNIVVYNDGSWIIRGSTSGGCPAGYGILPTASGYPTGEYASGKAYCGIAITASGGLPLQPANNLLIY